MTAGADEAFTLRIPFSFVPERGLASRSLPQRVETSGLSFELLVEEPLGIYVFTVSGFRTEEDAFQFAPRVFAGLTWAMLKLNTGILMNTEVQRPQYFEDLPVDGSYQLAYPVVYPNGKNLKWFWAGQPSARLNANASIFFERLLEGTNLPHADLLATKEKLQLALDMYILSLQESSSRATFLALITALEVLLPDTERPVRVVQRIDTWLQEVNAELEDTEIAPEVKASFEALCSGLENLKSESIGNRLRSFVQDVMSRAGAPDAVDIAKRAGKLYGLRSRVTHGGINDVAKHLADLKPIVVCILVRLLYEALS